MSCSQKADSFGHLPLSFCWKPSKLPHFRSTWFFHGCLPLLEPCPGTCLVLPRERATAAPNKIAIRSGFIARTGGATDQRLFACSRSGHSDRHSVGLHPAATLGRGGGNRQRGRQLSLESPNWHHRSPPGTQVHRMCDSLGPDGSRWGASEAHRKPIKQPIRWGCSRDPAALRASVETHHARHLL